MKIIRTIMITSLAIPTVLIACILIVFFAPMLAGYRVNASSSDVAKIAAERNDVSICRSILNVGFLVPTSWESRVHCVHEYASITKDPTACKGMRLDALMSCVGAAEDFEPCVILADDKQTVKGEGIETTFSSCEMGQKEIRDHVCCKMAKVLFTENNNCDNFPDGPLKDQCNHIVAVQTDNLELCAAIENKRNREGCEVIVRANKTEKLR